VKKLALLTILMAAGVSLFFAWRAGAFRNGGREISAEDVVNEAVQTGEVVRGKAAEMLESWGIEASE